MHGRTQQKVFCKGFTRAGLREGKWISYNKDGKKVTEKDTIVLTKDKYSVPYIYTKDGVATKRRIVFDRWHYSFLV